MRFTPIKLVIIVCILLSYFIVVSGTAITDQTQLSIESAQRFLGDTNLEIIIAGSVHVPHADYTILFNENKEIWVNNDTKVVERYSSYDEDNCKNGMISKKDALLIANSFIKNKRNIDLEDYTLLINELNDNGDVIRYDYLWREYIGEVESPNLVFISINPASGTIVTYVGIERPITISLNPKITQIEAINKAKAQFLEINLKESKSKLKVGYDKNGSQKLLWEITMTGRSKDYLVEGGKVQIDAETGEIFSIDQWL
jgi:hypothetical protein